MNGLNKILTILQGLSEIHMPLKFYLLNLKGRRNIIIFLYRTAKYSYKCQEIYISLAF